MASSFSIVAQLRLVTPSPTAFATAAASGLFEMPSGHQRYAACAPTRQAPGVQSCRTEFAFRAYSKKDLDAMWSIGMD